MVEEFVRSKLTTLGFSVEKIKESENSKCPDFMVKDAHSSYLIEVKTKFANPETITKINRTLDRGEIAEHSESLGRKNTLSSIVREGAEQLSSYTKEIPDFRLLWLQAAGYVPDNQMIQFEATLYGSVDIVDLENPKTSLRCFYFSFNEFFELRDKLDAVIISTENKAKLCLNNFSKRYERFKKSTLCKSLMPGVLDPKLLEAEGKAYIADCDISRKNKGAALGYIQKKYGKNKLTDLSNMSYRSALMSVPAREEEK